jgi:beta-galactosidase/beta-glucuronidase
VSRSVISLQGKWRFNAAPPPDFWTNSVDPAAWREVTVPGQLSTQGIDAQGALEGGGRGQTAPQGSQIAYKTKMAIPADFVGKRVVSKFQGVTAEAESAGNDLVAHAGFQRIQVRVLGVPLARSRDRDFVHY